MTGEPMVTVRATDILIALNPLRRGGDLTPVENAAANRLLEAAEEASRAAE
jgi:hypothetical protein